ncbi:hypothetical protein KIF24_24730 [Micromonospora sp. Llam7]|uniref:hypothetical protein n=1 Tax=Micromonospora tarapacensis TaxID=2835305 RepID=UPI001C834C32|nr:hypothetical protein [Micromonospora tarapacensis]MBX7268918.1 hypothetical protein [Micromonospora tarapacensis]
MKAFDSHALNQASLFGTDDPLLTAGTAEPVLMALHTKYYELSANVETASDAPAWLSQRKARIRTLLNCWSP